MKALLDAVLVDLGGVLVDDTPDAQDHDLRLRAGVLDDLVRLGEHLPVGAVTNTAIMDDDQVRQVLTPSGLADRLAVVVTSVDAGAPKPHPAPLLEALERLGLDDPNRVLFVGDRVTDEEAATAAGMPYIDIHSVESGLLFDAVEAWIDKTAGHRFELARSAIVKSDPEAAAAAAGLQNELAKPVGALGRLEALGAQLAAIAGTCPPPSPSPADVVVFAADHGIADWNVSAWPQKRTAQMVGNVLEGGASVSVLAHTIGARVTVVDVGVATPLPVTDDPALVHRSVRPGTDNLATGAAMSRREALLALDVGTEIAQRAVADGARCLIAGDLGIGNSTAAAAVIAAITNTTPDEVVGRASGADDEMLSRKKVVIESALENLATAAGPLTVLEQVGGLELAAIAGFIVGGASCRVPVVIDGVGADAALLVAVQLAPDLVDYVIAGHRAGEPAAGVALDHLGLTPLLDLELHLGEGSGAVLALPLLEAAVAVMHDMAVLEALDEVVTVEG